MNRREFGQSWLCVIVRRTKEPQRTPVLSHRESHPRIIDPRIPLAPTSVHLPTRIADTLPANTTEEIAADELAVSFHLEMNAAHADAL